MLERSDQNWLKRLGKRIWDIPAFAIWDGELPRDVIPSFIFHKVLADEFEGLLTYLKDNQYRTLGPGEYYEYLTGRKRDNGKKVILTFDDGLRNNWSVAYPILKKMGMKAVFYVNPGMMPVDSGPGPTLEDVWAGTRSTDELDAIEKDSPFFGWCEAKKMEDSGVIHIESHGWRHRICFTEDRIIDFQRPDAAGNPVYSWLFTAVDAEPTAPLWGTPVYPYKPRLAAHRFRDDVGLRQACMDYVRRNGEKKFFERGDWRVRLMEVVGEYEKDHSLQTSFENPDEQEMAIRDSLIHSKKMIEEKLGKKCEHFAYPWNVSGRLSLLWLRELEFKTVFRFMNMWQMPRVGTNPYDLSRVEGYWIKGLPGKGREGVWKKLGRRLIRTRKKDGA